MNAVEVLAHLKEAGVTATRHGDRIRLAPPQAIPPGLLEEVRLNKAALLRMLGPELPVRCLACQGSDFWRGTVRYADGTVEPGPWVCKRCHPPATASNERSNQQSDVGGDPRD